MKKIISLLTICIFLTIGVVFSQDSNACPIGSLGIPECTNADGTVTYQRPPDPIVPSGGVVKSADDKCTVSSNGTKVCTTSTGLPYSIDPPAVREVNPPEAPIVSKGNGTLEYEMVSYSGNEQGGGRTPFFNLDIFNNRVFVINYTSFNNGFQSLFDFIIGISIAIAVIVFMIAAFQKIIDGKDVGSVKKGDEGMRNAIVGLMIILSTWLIINTINPDLLRLSMFQNLGNLQTENSNGPSGSSSGELRSTGE